MKEKCFTLISDNEGDFHWRINTLVQRNGAFHGIGHITLTDTIDANRRIRKYRKTPRGRQTDLKKAYKRRRRLGFRRIGLEISGCINHHLTP